MALARGMGMAGKGIIVVRNDRWYKVICLIAFLTTSFAMGGQALACIFPSFTEMSKGRSMACCTEHCRMEATPQAAQKACDQSRTALTSVEAISNSSNTCLSWTMAKSLLDLGGTFLSHRDLFEPTIPLFRVHEGFLSNRNRSVEIYIFVHSFLI